MSARDSAACGVALEEGAVYLIAGESTSSVQSLIHMRFPGSESGDEVWLSSCGLNEDWARLSEEEREEPLGDCATPSPI